MERKTIVKQGRCVAFAACALLIGASVMQSCKDDDLILTGQPEWLGNSIYERLQDEGNYKYTLRLIDDLDLKEVLSHTGSKTLFVASDSAYDAWFSSNNWGVSKYEDLSEAKKKTLLKNSMINNAYLLELMSNGKAEGDAATPEWGRTMRRESSVELFDSVYIMPLDSMPKVKYWDYVRKKGKNIPLLKDATRPTMIHFLPAYLEYNKITLEDLQVLTNGKAQSINEAWVNGKKVTGSGDPSRKKIDYDVTCKNGYIQKVDGVIESSPNMAEIIRQDPSMSTWSHLLDRFSAPYRYLAGTREYNRIYNNEDTLYVLRYFSKRGFDPDRQTVVTYTGTGTDNPIDPEGNYVLPYLKYDPAWNQYIDANEQNDVHNDAGVMIVPSDKAMDEWWNGAGKELQDEYHYLDSVPDEIIAKLINVNMLSTFSEAVPSKFDLVLNDAKEKLGIKPEDVKGAYMGCNGMVYKTEKVFTPAEFQSVAYPALAHVSTMNIIYQGGIEGQGFLPYLLSMDSKYGMLLPTNRAMFSYVDPGSYGMTSLEPDGNGDSVTVEKPDIIEFTYNTVKKSVVAARYEGVVDANGNISKGTRKQAEISQSSKPNVISRLFDAMMDQLIIVMPDKTMKVEDYVKQGYTYFKTKGGALIRATFKDNNPDSLAFQGGWQLEHNNRMITAVQKYDKDNGRSYQLDSQVPMGAQTSLYLLLKKHPEFSGFLELVQNDYSDLLSTSMKGVDGNFNAGMTKQDSYNFRVFDNYNYTVFVPTNEAIQDLQNKKILPMEAELSRGDFSEATGEEPAVDSICKAEGWYSLYTKPLSTKSDSAVVWNAVVKAIRGVVTDFIRYHVQDNSVAIGLARDPNASTTFESMKRNPETGRYYPLYVNYDTNTMTVKDAMGNPHSVKKDKGLYNLICREYWFKNATYGNNTQLSTANNAVVHQIDGVLMYENLKPWRKVVEEAIKALN
ncbi:hypothetical protein [uncultured Prevotella sp.]|uniref:hypothetical protein n=1 Tax=uncultured Prevotella sp. TaxID=159272 RepID=UPI0025D1F722|nr:hypothetical protein [uncultured Prevotella sp.]